MSWRVRLERVGCVWSRAYDKAGIIAESEENQSFFTLYVGIVLYKSLKEMMNLIDSGIRHCLSG